MTVATRLSLVGVVALALASPARAATCPQGYSYAHQTVPFSGSSYAATLTMNAAPTVLKKGEHTNSYISVDHRRPDGRVDYWIQGGIIVGLAGKDGVSTITSSVPILYAEALTATGYEIRNLGPATVGASYAFSFIGRAGGSTWTMQVGGSSVMTVDLGAPVNDRGTAAEVYRYGTTGECPTFDWTFLGDVLGVESPGVTSHLPFETFAGGYRTRLPVPIASPPPPPPPSPAPPPVVISPPSDPAPAPAPVLVPPSAVPTATTIPILALSRALLAALRADASRSGQIIGEAKNEPPFAGALL